MLEHKIFSTAFSKVYPLYIQKAERKGRTRQEVDAIVRWLTGYDEAGLWRLGHQTSALVHQGLSEDGGRESGRRLRFMRRRVPSLPLVCTRRHSSSVDAGGIAA